MRSVSERFLEKVEPSLLCWKWLGARSADGYGTFRDRGGQVVYAHRFGYELLRDLIPPGLVLDHLCRDRLCVNPDHLEPVTIAENSRRGRVARRAVRPRAAAR